MLYTCALDFTEISHYDNQWTAFSHYDTVITYFPLFLFSYQKSVLYLPVYVYQWFPNLVTTIEYIPQVLFDFKLMNV